MKYNLCWMKYYRFMLNDVDAAYLGVFWVNKSVLYWDNIFNLGTIYSFPYTTTVTVSDWNQSKIQSYSSIDVYYWIKLWIIDYVVCVI